ncbi:hypothetical protein ACFL96_18610, partial [Thermoproteota archaeon]
MLKRGWIYAIAFVIYLMLILPVYSSVVWANIVKVDVFGNDYVLGARKSDDDTYIRADVVPMPGENSVASSQLRIRGLPTNLFNCDLMDNATKLFQCSAYMPGYESPGNKNDLILEMTARTGGGDDSEAISYVVDLAPPVINMQPLITKGINIDASFLITDRACETCGFDECVGVSTIKFTADNSPVHTVQIEDSAGCSVEDTANFSVPVTGTQNKTICLVAIDGLGHSSQACDEVTLDMSKPSVTDFNFSRNGAAITYVNEEPVKPVKLVVQIHEDSGLNTSDVSANLSALNTLPAALTSTGFNYDQKSPTSCRPLGNKKHECVWDGLTVYITETNPMISINLEDSNGNVQNETFESGIILDNVAPVIASIATEKVDVHGRSWAGLLSNTIYVSIQEDGSGFHNKMIALDFSAFGGQEVSTASKSNHVLSANICEPSWTCRWENIMVTGAELLSGEDVDVAGGSIMFEESSGGGYSPTANSLVHGVDGIRFELEAIDLLSTNNSNENAGVYKAIFEHTYDNATLLTNLAEFPSGSPLPLSIIYGTADDAFNRAEGLSRSSVFFDGIPPKILDHELIYDCPTAEERFEFMLRVIDEDSGEPKITYDTSDITLIGTNMTQPCQELATEPGQWVCPILIENLPSYGIPDADIPFWIEDLAGNTLEHTYKELTGEPARICESVEGTPNILDIGSVSLITPAKDEDNMPAIDRKIVSITAYPVFFDIDMIWPGHPSTSGAEILSTNIIDCFLVDTNGSVSDSFNLMEFNASYPLIGTKIMIDESVVSDNTTETISMGCNLSFMVRHGTFKYTQPEIENFVVELPLTDSPLGYINDSTADKLEGIVDDIKDIQDTIDSLEILNYIFGAICTIGTFAVLLVEIFVGLKFIMLIVGIFANIGGSDAANAFWKA